MLISLPVAVHHRRSLAVELAEAAEHPAMIVARRVAAQTLQPTLDRECHAGPEHTELELEQGTLLKHIWPT